MNLRDLGWRDFFAGQFAEHEADGRKPCRVARQEMERFLLCAEEGDFDAEVAGRLRLEADQGGPWPAVGDWVAASLRPEEGRATIHAVLDRQTRFSRRAAGGVVAEQVVAANVDWVWLVCGLDHNFNLRRIERYLAVAWDSGAQPVVVLNKADLCDDVERRVGMVEALAPGAPVHAVSAHSGDGMDALARYLAPGQTVTLVGSSGVGKSSLVNRVLGEERLEVGETRASDGRGRHTTTRRELIALPGGGLLMDTPGMRELGLWGDEDSLDGSFADIDALAVGCRFRDCRHQGEPGCAVQAAVERGEVSEGRWENYKKMQKELRYLALKQDTSARLAERARWKPIAKAIKRLPKKR